MPRKSTIAPTLSAANQNSNSPKFFTAARFVPQNTSMNSATQAHSGVPGNQPVMMPAAPMASRPTATHSRNQNAQPAVKPAHGPMARSACTEKEPEAGLAADISPSMRITSMTSSPERAYATTIDGPAAAMPAPEPTKSPAPMTPPRAIIDRWRCLRPCVSVASAGWSTGAGAVVRDMGVPCS
ncbi:hypothetical protein RKD22_002844 [Streptomyces pristinaespiralis]